ncbi:uncharacterized protein RSE6_09213 [Rhynchosporium secalis]|uniref:Pisatin demethylase cytochrome P450 n=1 Tax=Rhynchosporium secalis TaxID=38038 RepID=A0A1E1MHE0_RHYSE|nr:uncharacterized protein RSE6_09213 [Rhynchosporium secalis]
MSLLWIHEILLATILGILSHLLFFIKDELDQYAATIVAVFCVLCSILSALILLQELNLVRASALTNLLTATYLSSLGGSITLYRLAFHRTRAFPGRRLNAISKLFAAYKSIQAYQYHHVLANLHQKHGDIVRIRPNELSINSAEAHSILYGSNSECTKGPWYSLGGVGLNLHRTRDVYLHSKQRPFWEEAFSVEALDRWMVNLNCQVDRLIENISALDTFDMSSVLSSHGFDMMSAFTFSKGIEIPPPPDTAQALRLLSQSQQLLGSIGHVPWMYGIAKYLPLLLQSSTEFTKLADQKVNSRRARGEPTIPDLFSFLLETESNPLSAGFPLSWEARLAIVVGSKILSIIVTAASFYLAINPTLLASLRDDLDPLFHEGNFDPRKQHSGLDSILNESMRLQPPKPSGLQRVSPSEGLSIGNVFIPGNTICRMPHFVAWRDDRNLVEPDLFIPERWTTKKEMLIHPEVFKPLGSGDYDCVGRRLAWVQLRLTLALLVVNFDWELQAGVDATTWEIAGRIISRWSLTLCHSQFSVDRKGKKSFECL